MKHFKLKEFVDSPTAACLGIDNTPDAAAVDALKAILKNLGYHEKEGEGIWTL